MRVAIRGRGTPASLVEIIRQFAERLEAAGVDRLVGVNLYLHPLFGNRELKLVSEIGKDVDILEMQFPSGDLELAARPPVPDDKRVLSGGRLHITGDSYDCRMFFLNSERIGIPKSVICRLLGGIGEKRWFELRNCFPPELSRTERKCMPLFAELYRLARQMCGSEDAMVRWFTGPYPHSALFGETPAEQLVEGGLFAAAAMIEGLKTYRGDGRLDGGMPPKHFDLYEIDWTNWDALCEKERKKASRGKAVTLLGKRRGVRKPKADE